MPEPFTDSPAAAVAVASADAAADEVEAELLVEEVSIDGLCGVY
jgi:mycofactocin precursor